ncbi:MAG TPA: DinB family protein [Dehalococcoidia bacterium]|nr:DinB family protein [Dehalococcoidia bacterium]
MTVPGERTEAQLQIIEALKRTPLAVEAEIEGLSDAVLRYRPAEGEWSIKEVVGHLRDVAEAWHKRISAVCTLTDPILPAWERSLTYPDRNYQDASLDAVIMNMQEWRLKTVEVLAHAVDWTRLGQHLEQGRRSLRQWGEFMIAHEAEHLATIRSLKEAQTAARLP